MKFIFTVYHSIFLMRPVNKVPSQSPKWRQLVKLNTFLVIPCYDLRSRTWKWLHSLNAFWWYCYWYYYHYHYFLLCYDQMGYIIMQSFIYLFIYSFFREVLILKHAMMLLLPWKDKIFFVISVADLLSIEAKWVKFLKVIYIQFQIQWNMYNLEIPIFYISLLNLY